MQDIEIKINKRQFNRLEKVTLGLGKYVSKPVKALKQIGLYMLGSIEKNFEEEGRPIRWVPLSPITIARRRKGKSPYGIRILSDTGNLKNSVSFKVKEDGSSVSIGTNVKYAPTHQFGSNIPKHVSLKKRSKALKMLRAGKTKKATKMISPFFRVPKRPFLMFQEEDVEAIRQIIVTNLQDAIKE